jgi:glycosyltransferase involved in cell wall biosynthesis
MEKKYPLVSVIMPTRNREAYLRLAINRFFCQDYPNKELIIIVDADDENTIDCVLSYQEDDYTNLHMVIAEKAVIGVKRNIGCEKAQGEIIMHQDDDDEYANDWISKSVEHLMENDCDVTGLSQFYLYDNELEDLYMYNYHDSGMGLHYVTGATMCYWKKFWERHRFEPMQIGEDAHFIWCAVPPCRIRSHEYISGFLASIHNENTSRREVLNGLVYRKVEGAEKECIMQIWGY